MKLQESFKKFLPYILLVNFVIIIYSPLILKGGIIIDDWGNLANNFQCEKIFDRCFIELYKSAFLEIFANRPLAPLPIVLATVLFKTNFTWYLLLNSTLYFLAILITAYVVKRVAGAISSIIFSYVAVIPFIAIPLVVSPINLLDSTLAYLFWAISLFLLYRYCQFKSLLTYFLSYLLLFCGLLTYEVFLPLLVMNALIPLIIDKSRFQSKKFSYLIKYIAPLFFTIMLIYLWQRVIGPIYFDINSRLNFNFNNIIPSFISWMEIFYDQVPSVFFKIKKFWTTNIILSSIILISSILISCKLLAHKNSIKKVDRYLYLLICLICLLSSSIIFVLTGAKASISGYEARALSSTWIGFALVCSALFPINSIVQKPFISKITLLAILGILFLSCISFGIQRNNYIKSWQLQMHIINDAMDLISKEDIRPGTSIIANVPAYFDENYNNELIFDTAWDFTSALQVLTNRLIIGGPVIDAKRGNFHNLKIFNQVLSIDGIEISNFNKLWFYDYDSNLNMGSLTKISDADLLKKKLVSLGYPTYLGELGQNSAIRTDEIISFSHDWQNRALFIKHGFAEREVWGVWSLGKEAELVLPLPIDNAKFLDLEVRAFVSKGHPIQNVEVTVDGVRYLKYILTQSENNQIRIPITKSTSAQDGIIRLQFKFPDAVSPRQIGIAQDNRILAVGFKSATFHKF